MITCVAVCLATASAAGSAHVRLFRRRHRIPEHHQRSRRLDALLLLPLACRWCSLHTCGQPVASRGGIGCTLWPLGFRGRRSGLVSSLARCTSWCAFFLSFVFLYPVPSFFLRACSFVMFVCLSSCLSFSLAVCARSSVRSVVLSFVLSFCLSPVLPFVLSSFSSFALSSCPPFSRPFVRSPMSSVLPVFRSFCRSFSPLPSYRSVGLSFVLLVCMHV